MNPHCGHLIYAYHNQLLPTNIDLDKLQELQTVFELKAEEIFEEIDDIEPMIEYFMILKEKVVKNFIEIENIDLKKYYQNFQIKGDGLFSTLDFVSLDQEAKTIEFITIQPSVWNPEKLFRKTLSTKGKTLKSLSRNMGFAADNFANWEQLKKNPDYNLINSLFREPYKFRIPPHHQEINYDYIAFIDLLISTIKENLLLTNGKANFKLTMHDNQFNFPLLTPLIWQKSKSKIYYNFIYNFGLLLEKYPDYKITGKIAFIKKDNHSKQYSFHYFTKEINNHNPSQEMIFNKKKILADLNEVRSKVTIPGIKWFPNNRYPHYDFLNNNCKICQEGEKFFRENVDEWFLEEMSPPIYDSFQCQKVNNLLKTYPQKLAMFDFETITDPMPQQSYYNPWDKMIVQVSCHLLEGTKIVDHQEYIVQNLSIKEIEKVYNIILQWVKDGYTLVSYYKAFENSVIRTMERILQVNTISSLVNTNPDSKVPTSNSGREVLDLFDFFRKRGKSEEKWISWKRFQGSASIKYTIQLAHPTSNPYQNLTINNGFLATKILYEHFNQKAKDKVTVKDLYKYCYQDTLSMVDIYQSIINQYQQRCGKNE